MRKKNIFLMLFLVIITFGIYIPFWFLNQRESINNLDSAKKIGSKLINFLLIIYIINAVFVAPVTIFLASSMLFALTGVGIFGSIALVTRNIASLISLKGLNWLIRFSTYIPLLILSFKTRGILDDHFNKKLNRNIVFSGSYTFFFTIYYLQYKLNHLVDIPQKSLQTNSYRIIITIIIAVIIVLAWAPWLNNQSLHDKVFLERAKIDGTIDKYTGELICDYNVMWVPFGRWIVSCERGYYITFWSKILFSKSTAVENPCAVCINGCDTCPEGCGECLISIEKKLKDPNMKWYYNPEESKKLNKITIPVFINDEPDTVINSILQSFNSSSLNIKFSSPEKSSQWWVSDDGWSIIVPNAVSITVANAFKWEHMSPVNPLNTMAKELNDLISKIFLDNGFTLNITNTSKSEADNDFYDYIVAFQKGETRCILETNGDYTGVINEQYYEGYRIVCSNRFQEAHDEQIRYVKALNERNSIVTVIERIGNFVWLKVHFRRAGYVALVKDSGGKIEVIFTGIQEPPSCDLFIKNQVPKEVYESCYNASGDLVE